VTLNLSDSVLQRRVFNQNIYNLHRQHYMLGQTAKFIDKNSIVLDIGAAVGMYTHFWAGLAKHVYSFEAVPPVYEQLKLVADRNDNVTAINYAVGREDKDEVTFYVDDKRLSNSGLRDLVGGQPITVEMVSIDSWAQSWIDSSPDNMGIGLIKIDVEGNELDVLRGATLTISNERPAVMCEVYPKFNDGPVADTFHFLMDIGYRCFYNIRGQGLKEITSVAEGVDVASNEQLIPLHDGDFLFVYKD